MGVQLSEVYSKKVAISSNPLQYWTTGWKDSISAPILMILVHHHSVAQLKADNADAPFQQLSCQESLWSSGTANTQWALYHPHFCCRMKITLLTPSACPQSHGSIIPQGARAHSVLNYCPRSHPDALMAHQGTAAELHAAAWPISSRKQWTGY